MAALIGPMPYCVCYLPPCGEAELMGETDSLEEAWECVRADCRTAHEGLSTEGELSDGDEKEDPAPPVEAYARVRSWSSLGEGVAHAFFDPPATVPPESRAWIAVSGAHAYYVFGGNRAQWLAYWGLGADARQPAAASAPSRGEPRPLLHGDGTTPFEPEGHAHSRSLM